MSIPRTTISPGGILEGNVRSYTCASNTVTEGPTESVCQINGQWSLTAYDLYCRRKQTSRHLTFISFCTRIFVVNTSANYWNLSLSADCGEPLPIDRAVIGPGSNLEGSTRFYSCASNTVAQGRLNIVCQPDGTWSMTNLYCRRKYWPLTRQMQIQGFFQMKFY